MPQNHKNDVVGLKNSERMIEALAENVIINDDF